LGDPPCEPRAVDRRALPHGRATDFAWWWVEACGRTAGLERLLRVKAGMLKRALREPRAPGSLYFYWL
jgi:hypothetical protein